MASLWGEIVQEATFTTKDWCLPSDLLQNLTFGPIVILGAQNENFFGLKNRPI
jgi:hypothetical protein